jgi:hypothetical protein
LIYAIHFSLFSTGSLMSKSFSSLCVSFPSQIYVDFMYCNLEMDAANQPLISPRVKRFRSLGLLGYVVRRRSMGKVGVDKVAYCSVISGMRPDC